MAGQRLLRSIIAVVCVYVPSLCRAETGIAPRPPARPNIIFILADDLGYGDLGCYGQTLISTPRLDRLAQNGIRFTNHYSGSTVCSPSRCCLLTGMHTGHSSIRSNKNAALRANEPTIGSMLKGAGYETAIIGKWGLGASPRPGDPERYGFKSFFGYLDMRHAHNHFPDYLWNDMTRVPIKGNIVTTVGQGGVAIKRTQYSNDLFEAAAAKFIEENKQRPFFLYLATAIPHANNEAGKEGMEVPDDSPYHDRDWPQAQKNHAAMITRLDTTVGAIVDQLDKLNLSRDTLVMFSSDNGPHSEGGADPKFFQSSGGLRGHKRDLYEGGIRVPLIANWPGKIAPGRVTDLVSAFWDVMPTLAEAACIERPGNIDGISFLPTLLDQPSLQRRHLFLYWEFDERGPKQAVRLGNWKLIRDAAGRTELYNLQADPSETRDVAAKQPAVVQSIDFVLQSSQTTTNPLYRVKAGKARRHHDDDHDD